MKFLYVLRKLLSDWRVEFFTELFIAHKAYLLGVHKEELIVHKEVSEEDSKDALELKYWHAIHVDYLHYVGNHLVIEGQGSRWVQD